VLLLSPPGCGKSALCKAVGNENLNGIAKTLQSIDGDALAVVALWDDLATEAILTNRGLATKLKDPEAKIISLPIDHLVSETIEDNDKLIIAQVETTQLGREPTAQATLLSGGSAANLHALVAARDRQQRLLDDIVVAGAEQGVFSTPFPREASRAVVTMCTGVSQWYRPGGDLSPTDLASQYIVMTRMTVGAPMDDPGA
jgi:hypothetical protein